VEARGCSIKCAQTLDQVRERSINGANSHDKEIAMTVRHMGR
jgi:hypothetical protein